MKYIYTSDTKEVIPLQDLREQLALARTELALENTLLAWIRTVIAFMGTGVAIGKGTEALHNARVIKGEAIIEHAYITGIILTITGTILLIVITVLFITRKKQISRRKRESLFTVLPSVLMSVCAIIIGVGLSYLLIIS